MYLEILVENAFDSEDDKDYEDEAYDTEVFPVDSLNKHHFDIVVKFWLLNNLLPPPEKFEVVPSSGIIHKSVIITEFALLVCLPKKRNIFGENRNLWYLKSKLQKPQGSLWKALFPDIFAKRKLILVDQVNEQILEEKKRKVLLTALKTDGLGLSLLYLDLKTKPAIKKKESTSSPLELANKVAKRKKIKSDILTDQEKKKITTVVGGDPGEVYYVGLCATKVENYSFDEKSKKLTKFAKNATVTNLKLKSSAAAEPSRLYRNFLEHEKLVANSNDDRQFKLTKAKLDVYALELSMERKLTPTENRHFKIVAGNPDDLADEDGADGAQRRHMTMSENGIYFIKVYLTLSQVVG